MDFARAGSSAPEESIVRTNDDGFLRDIAFNWNPMVTKELVGTYYCRAQNPLGNDSRIFTISGVCTLWINCTDHVYI